MIFNKKTACGNDSLTEKLKRDVKKRWKIPKPTNERRYNRMVEEAVYVITANWKNKIKHSDQFQYPAKEAELVAHNAFLITDDLELISESVYALDYNWKTGKCYFHDLIKFESKEMADKFVSDVLSRLPKDTICNTTVIKKDARYSDYYDCIKYSFTLKLNFQ